MEIWVTVETSIMSAILPKCATKEHSRQHAHQFWRVYRYISRTTLPKIHAIWRY